MGVWKAKAHRTGDPHTESHDTSSRSTSDGESGEEMSETSRTMEAVRQKRVREPRRSFMAPDEVVRLRTQVIRATQESLAEELVRPDTGESVSKYTLCRWERGRLAVPLWAARRLRAL